MDAVDETLLRALLELRARATDFKKVRTRRSMIDERRSLVTGSGDVPARVLGAPVSTSDLPQDPAGFTPPDRTEEPRRRASVDDRGRPLFAEGDDYVLLWTWGTEFAEELSIPAEGRGHDTSGERVVHGHDGVIVGAVGCRGTYSWVQRWSHDDRGRVARVERATESDEGWWVVAAEATYDEVGRIARVDRSEHEDASAPAGSEVDEGLRLGLTVATTLRCSRLAWDARWQRPEPLRDDTCGMGRLIADGLVRALREATRDAGLSRTACIEVGGGGDIFRTLPPRVLAADEEWQAALHRRKPKPQAVPRLLDDGWRAKDVPEIDLVPFVDEDTLQACREIETALDFWSPKDDQARARPVVLEIGQLLSVALTDPTVVPDPLPSFLALVATGDDTYDTVTRARTYSGDGRVGRFLGQDDTAPAVARPAADHADLARRAVVEHDRGALRELAASIGLEQHAAHLAEKVAAVALVGVPANEDHTSAAGRSVRSRVGGPPVLPPGMAWPRIDDRRPLSFVAALDLAEVPTVDHGPRWPTDGWLLIYADIDGEPEGDDTALYEVQDNSEGAAARVLVVPAGDAPVSATTAGHPSEVEPTNVTWWPRMTLPNDWAHEAGLDAFAAQAYEELLSELERVPNPGEDEEVWEPAMWLRGHARERVDGTKLLLHIEDGWSEGLHLITSSLEVHLPDDAFTSWDLSRAQLRTVVL